METRVPGFHFLGPEEQKSSPHTTEGVSFQAWGLEDERKLFTFAPESHRVDPQPLPPGGPGAPQHGPVTTAPFLMMTGLSTESERGGPTHEKMCAQRRIFTIHLLRHCQQKALFQNQEILAPGPTFLVRMWPVNMHPLDCSGPGGFSLTGEKNVL